MIALHRHRTAEAVHENFRGRRRIAYNLTLLKKKRDGQLNADSERKWDSKVWKAAKAQLLIENSR